MNKPKTISNQQGMVAIVTTMILMIVISLIVLGFSQAVRRNQRQVLDTQLSSQAFYAAESGLNLAREKLTNPATAYSERCDDDETSNPSDYILDGNNVVISCLIITPVRDDERSAVGTNSKAALIDPAGTGNVGTMFIGWQSETPTGSLASCTGVTTFPAATASGWACSEPLLRIDIVPLDVMTQAALIGSQYTAFLSPRSGSTVITTTNFIAGSKGNIIAVNCNTTPPSGDRRRNCTLRIDGMNNQRYGIRLMGVYREASTSIHVIGNPILEGSQAIADSTGRAADVIKRVQARISLGSDNDITDFAISSNNALCKTYKVANGGTQITSPDAECNP